MAESKKSTESKSEPIKYKKHPIDVKFEEVEYTQDHGTFKKKDKRSVHPNVAILLKSKGIAK